MKTKKKKKQVLILKIEKTERLNNPNLYYRRPYLSLPCKPEKPRKPRKSDYVSNQEYLYLNGKLVQITKTKTDKAGFLTLIKKINKKEQLKYDQALENYNKEYKKYLKKVLKWEKQVEIKRAKHKQDLIDFPRKKLEYQVLEESYYIFLQYKKLNKLQEKLKKLNG